MGREEIDIIRPAIDRLSDVDAEIRGPLAGDTMFHEAARGTYDVAVCMYHDQALIPMKTLDFDNGVNVSVGLPFVRTSPITAPPIISLAPRQPIRQAWYRPSEWLRRSRHAGEEPGTVTAVPDTPALSALPPLRDVIAAHGLSPRKSLGQNFLLDLNITRRIAGTAGPLDGKTVLEIGPGPGGLTRALLDAGARRVVAVERDTRCIDVLRELAAIVGDRLQILERDAMEFDLEPLAAASGKIAIVANLPYNIATPLLIGWLKRIEFINRMVLMFQSEVADRLIATPGSKTYGRISIAAQWRCR